MRRRHVFSLLLLLRVALVGGAEAQAQVPADPGPAPITAADFRALARSWREPIGRVLSDADADLRPDRVGDTVTVAGRASVGSGHLHYDYFEVFIQDATGGIRLLAPIPLTFVAEGDSVVVRGVLEFRHGMAQIGRPVYRVIPSTRRVPRPIPFDPATQPIEALEGRLVTFEGPVATVFESELGQTLTLLIEDQLLSVYVNPGHAEPISLDAFESGDFISVTGIATQHDLVPPYTGSYVLLPLREEDVQRSGLQPGVYRNGAIGAGLLLLVVLGWVSALRREVRRRVDEVGLSEARYQNLFDRASDAVFLHDVEAGGFLEVNRVAVKELGYTPDELRPLSLRALATPASAESAEGHLRAVRMRGEALTEIELRRRDGTAVPFEFHSHRLDVGGRPVLLSIARNVTARKAYEAGLIEARRAAEEMARMKSAFLANMSHEIRTPLTGIIGFAEVLREEVGPLHQEFVRTIESGGRRLLNTLNSVLDLARLDAGREQLRPQVLDVVHELQTGLALFVPLARDRGVALRVVADVPALSVVQDATALDRVLTNLVGNALKFTERGAIRVALQSLGAPPGHFLLRVEDTGIGIDAAFLPSLFEEFKQESDGFARSHEGTGLGLAISRRLVELMGGQIEVASEKGVGTAFTLTLPLIAPGAEDLGEGVVEPMPEAWYAPDEV